MVKEVYVNSDDGQFIEASLIEKIQVNRADADALRAKIETYKNEINERNELIVEAEKSLEFLDMIIANADSKKTQENLNNETISE